MTALWLLIPIGLSICTYLIYAVSHLIQISMAEKATCDIHISMYADGKNKADMQVRVNMSSVRINFAVPPTHEIFHKIQDSLTTRFPGIPWERALSTQGEYSVETGASGQSMLEYKIDRNYFPVLQFTLPHRRSSWVKRWGELRQSILFRKDMEALSDYILAYGLNKNIPSNTPPDVRLDSFLANRPLSFSMPDGEGQMYDHLQQLLSLYRNLSPQLLMHNAHLRHIRNVHLDEVYEILGVYASTTDVDQKIRLATEILRTLEVLVSTIEECIREEQNSVFEYVKQKVDKMEWMLSESVRNISK